MKGNIYWTYKFQHCIVLIFIAYSLLLFSYYNKILNNDYFYIQLLSIFAFILFFLIGKLFTAKAYLIFILIYQLSFSVIFSTYFLQHTYLLDNNRDWITYVNWASIAWDTTDFSSFISVLSKKTTEIADLGYPVFLYPFYNLFKIFDYAYLSSVIAKSLFFTLGCLYVYKLSLHLCDKKTSKIIFLLWGLNPASLFFNGVNLKESVFVTICIFATYGMVVYRDTKKTLYLFSFLFFTFLTIFFRIFVTFFLVATFFAVTVFRKFIERHFFSIWVCIALCGIIMVKILMSILGNLAYFVGQSLGGGSGISMPVLIFLALISPVPALNQYRTTPDNLLIVGYSIFTVFLSFYAIYEVVVIFREKRERLYLPLFLIFFNKLLVIISARSNEYRFQYPLAFLYVIFMVLGFSDISKSGFYLGKRRKINITTVTLVFSLISMGVTVLYNKM